MLESNDAWLNIVGRTREELERGEISWRAITAPEWAAQDDQVTRKLDAEGWVAPYEKEYVRPDGTRAPVLLSARHARPRPAARGRRGDRPRGALRRRPRARADPRARARGAPRGRAGGGPVGAAAARDRGAVGGELGRRGRRGRGRPGRRGLLRGGRGARLPRGRPGRDALRPRLREHRDGRVAPVPAPHRRSRLRRAADRRGRVPGDARRLGALSAAASGDHRCVRGDGRGPDRVRRARVRRARPLQPHGPPLHGRRPCVPRRARRPGGQRARARAAVRGARVRGAHAAGGAAAGPAGGDPRPRGLGPVPLDRRRR